MITLGKTYFYNNRPVVPLALEHGEIYRCYIGFQSIPDGVEGKYFCHKCMAGGTVSHVCDQYDDVIAAIEESISDQEIIWVPRIYLKDSPVEWLQWEKLQAENERLKAGNQEMRNRYSEISRHLRSIEDKPKKAEELAKQLEIKSIALSEKYQAEVDQLSEKLERVDSISIGTKTISVSEFKEIYLNHLRMQDLDTGGVDNWQWYGESVRDQEDYKTELAEFFSN